VVDIPHAGPFVTEQDWFTWATTRLRKDGNPASGDERAAVCDVRIYRNSERDAYVSYVLNNQTLP
jgi:hypothetical protein